MKTVSSGLAAALAENPSTLAICWLVEGKDGRLIAGTEHDKDIDVSAYGSVDLSGVYSSVTGITASSVRSTADLSVDNMEVDGMLSAIFSNYEMSAEDIDAGIYDNAQVTLFLVDWSDPSTGYLILRRGNIGDITRTAEGKYTTELRGLTQRLSQVFIRTMEVNCDADLGDSRCGITLTSTPGSVVAAYSRRIVEVDVTLDSPSFPLQGGRLVFTTGANAGYTREIKVNGTGDSPPTIEVFEEFPADIEAGDEFVLWPGCDKSILTCKNVYDNVVQFRGYAVFTPTLNSQIAGPWKAHSPQEVAESNGNIFVSGPSPWPN